MTDQDFIEICKNSNTMSEAASKTGMHFNTFKNKAIKLKCYNANQGGKGTSKPKPPGKFNIPLDEILNGKHPQYQTFKLKNKLFESGLKQNICEECGTFEWNGKEIKCELDHVDGDRTNHKLDNLKILCPNCHSQTETYKAKNIGRVVKR